MTKQALDIPLHLSRWWKFQLHVERRMKNSVERSFSPWKCLLSSHLRERRLSAWFAGCDGILHNKPFPALNIPRLHDFLCSSDLEPALLLFIMLRWLQLMCIVYFHPELLMHELRKHRQWLIRRRFLLRCLHSYKQYQSVSSWKIAAELLIIALKNENKWRGLSSVDVRRATKSCLDHKICLLNCLWNLLFNNFLADCWLRLNEGASLVQKNYGKRRMFFSFIFNWKSKLRADCGKKFQR